MSETTKEKISESLYLYNTESRSKERFTPRQAPEVTIYSCGPTVYDYTTIGNLRSYVFADILRRTLTWNGYQVRSTINFTDFGHLTDDADAGEDKILRALQAKDLPLTLDSMRLYTDHYIDLYKKDTAALNIIPPTTYARASDFVTEQIDLIAQLESKGHTYQTSDGIYFAINTFPQYGKLGNIDLDSLQSGARVAINKEKQHPADFALWKFGALGWDSQWGRGFPGWHIECSTMAMRTLGESIDIHTGGIDHIHTHHNAEIAQSEAATGKRFANYWLHNAFITIDGQRIGKSVGNAITIPELQQKGYDPLAYRYWLLTAHYRSPANFSYSALDQASQALERLQRHYYEDYQAAAGTIDTAVIQAFTAAINQDLDTPQALSVIWGLVRSTEHTPETKAGTLRKMDQVLGLGLDLDKAAGLTALGIYQTDTLPEPIQTLVAAREQARAEQQWTEADRLRAELQQAGYSVEDTTAGPVVKRLKT